MQPVTRAPWAYSGAQPRRLFALKGPEALGVCSARQLEVCTFISKGCKRLRLFAHLQRTVSILSLAHAWLGL